MGQWDGLHERAAAKLVTRLHARAFEALDAGAVDLIGFHGQTLAHDPDNRRTLQWGWCNWRATLAILWSGIFAARMWPWWAGGAIGPVFSFCLREIYWGKRTHCLPEFRCWEHHVDPRLDDVTEQGAVLALDTGPANAPLNDFMMARLGQAYDANGALAATGMPDIDVVRAF